MLLALAVGVLSARLTDWRARAAVAVFAALVFVGFLTHRYGTLSGDPAPWALTPPIGLAALAGHAYRWRARVISAPALVLRRLRTAAGRLTPLRVSAPTHQR